MSIIITTVLCKNTHLHTKNFKKRWKYPIWSAEQMILNQSAVRNNSALVKNKYSMRKCPSNINTNDFLWTKYCWTWKCEKMEKWNITGLVFLCLWPVVCSQLIGFLDYWMFSIELNLLFFDCWQGFFSTDLFLREVLPLFSLNFLSVLVSIRLHLFSGLYFDIILVWNVFLIFFLRGWPSDKEIYYLACILQFSVHKLWPQMISNF